MITLYYCYFCCCLDFLPTSTQSVECPLLVGQREEPVEPLGHVLHVDPEVQMTCKKGMLCLYLLPSGM